MAAPDPNNGDNGPTPETPAHDADTGVSEGEDDAHWYSWRRWRYIGGGLFLLLSLAGVSYVIWDIVDLLPKPVTMAVLRAALRESPGRIGDVVMLAGLLSFGPPAGVDLMFGATEAARRWARKMQEKDKAEGRKEGREEGLEEGHEEGRKAGRAEGRIEGRAEGRIEVIAALRARANGNAELHRLLDEVENEGQ